MYVRQTLLLSLVALITAALGLATAAAQVPVDIPHPSEVIYRIKLGDGSTIFARITGADQARVFLETVGGDQMEVDRHDIKGIRRARGHIVDNEFWIEDPGSTRLFFTSTGRALGQGESYVGTYLIVLPFAAIGLTDRIAIAAGAPVVIGELEPYYLAPKVQILAFQKAQVSLGTLAFFFKERVVGVAYGVGTFGTRDQAVSAGLGYFYAGDDFSDKPAAMLGGELRYSRGIKVITENYVLPRDVGAVFSAGIRVIDNRFTSDMVVIGSYSEGWACCVPLFNFVYAFGR